MEQTLKNYAKFRGMDYFDGWLYLFCMKDRLGQYYELYGDDAAKFAELTGAPLATFTDPDNGEIIDVCGINADELDKDLKTLSAAGYCTHISPLEHDTETERERLLREYPTLTPITEMSYRQQGKTKYKNVRKLLALTFPGVKFSVRKFTASMMEEVQVEWTGGPEVQQVEEVVNLFINYSFNGYNDSGTYHSTEFNNLFGGIKFSNLKRNEE